jgi:hypothetical protein
MKRTPTLVAALAAHYRVEPASLYALSDRDFALAVAVMGRAA